MLTLTLAAIAVPAFASANQYIPPCGTSNAQVSRTVGTYTVGADVWAGSCVGATVWVRSPAIRCMGQDIDIGPSHTLVLYPGCTVGELVELP